VQPEEIDVRALPEPIYQRLRLASPGLERIFALGALDCLSQPQLAIVGSRRASPQGLRDALWFGQCLAESGMSVVSGLAIGVDSESHRGAIRGGGTTIAVLGHGLNHLYPSRNRRLLEEILHSGGLVLSEYSAETPARPHQFLQRNRIIAAISGAVCVIEAAIDSGSLTTALACAEFGGDVFAVPGSIHEPRYEGSHRLIREGACLVRSPHELLSDLGYRPNQKTLEGFEATASHSDQSHASNKRSFSQTPGGNDARAERILRAMDTNPIALSTLESALSLSAGEVLAGLLQLEVFGRVHRLSDGRWQQLH
jgi:DNA processing protein